MTRPWGAVVLACLLATAACASNESSPTVDGTGTASVTAEWHERLVVVVHNAGDTTDVEVAWSLQRPDGSWRTYHSEVATLPTGTQHVFRPDCVWRGLAEVSVVGQELTHREWYDGVPYCY